MNKKIVLPEVELYSDGGAAPNPGKGGYGVILSYRGVRKEFSKGYKKTTNNRMELTGVIVGLSKLKTSSKVQVFTDSQYTINGIEKGWAKKWKENNWYRTKSEKAINYDLWEKLLILVEKHDVSFYWVKGHNGHIENERCDELATLALNRKILIEDKGFENNSLLTPLFTIEEKTEGAKVIKKKNTNKITKSGDICGKCDTAVIKKIPKAKKFKPEQTFYYEYFFSCPNCKTNYMIPEGKREIKR